MNPPGVPFFSATGAAFGGYVLGPRVQAFEAAFARYLPQCIRA